LLQAKENDEKVMIFGDYDVDGVTSTSILMHFFKKI
jgi:single-stranded-DNA-specific exonuclease|tara:strand:- start:374 stop:481 length:108 start_codon:yes stop_codon:yes gene_type:complete